MLLISSYWTSSITAGNKLKMGGVGGAGFIFFLIMISFTHFFLTYDLCDWTILPIYIFLAPSHKRPFPKMGTITLVGM